MAQYQTGDGRWLVGDATGESSYHGFLGWRDCVIQLTGEGATEQSVHYLEALRDYALAHNPLGEPIMPPSINVWISNNGTTTAVQADDLSVDGEKFTIGGIAWDGSGWDYSDAGKASGGGSAPFIVTLTPTAADMSGTMDKTPAEIAGAYDAGKRIIAYAPAFGFRCELSLATIHGSSYTFDFIALGEQGGQDVMLRILTDSSNSTYCVKLYPLTQAT